MAPFMDILELDIINEYEENSIRLYLEINNAFENKNKIII